MEYASFLAGERWSDHPKCTHPLLAGVARVVNDQISDEGRTKLVPWIPEVIGLNGDDPAIDAGIAIRCAAIALPVAAAHRQRALAVGLMSARQVLTELEGQGSTIDTMDLLVHSKRALIRAPHAAEWAEDFVTGRRMTVKAFRRRSAPAIVRVAVVGIAEACISDPDDLLNQLLTTVITDCRGWLAPMPGDDSILQASAPALTR